MKRKKNWCKLGVKQIFTISLAQNVCKRKDLKYLYKLGLLNAPNHFNVLCNSVFVAYACFLLPRKSKYLFKIKRGRD